MNCPVKGHGKGMKYVLDTGKDLHTASDVGCCPLKHIGVLLLMQGAAASTHQYHI